MVEAGWSGESDNTPVFLRRLQVIAKFEQLLAGRKGKKRNEKEHR